MCGDCCKGFGGTYVTPEDIKAISGYLESDPDHFVEEYCQMSGGKPLIAEGESGYCIFWNEKCSIHPVKPRMCHAWPFIESVLIDIANWRIMGGSCPGIRVDASEDAVRECVEEELKKGKATNIKG